MSSASEEAPAVATAAKTKKGKKKNKLDEMEDIEQELEAMKLEQEDTQKETDTKKSLQDSSIGKSSKSKVVTHLS